jgi:hypothetical protein
MAKGKEAYYAFDLTLLEVNVDDAVMAADEAFRVSSVV